MAALIGRTQKFDCTQEEWQQYSEHLGQFIAANKVTEATWKRDVFLFVIGAKTYKLLSDLLSPDKPDVKPYGKLLQKHTDHYSPKPLGIGERFNFRSRYRRQEEKAADFVAELRAWAKN